MENEKEPSNGGVTLEALDDIRNRVKPILGQKNSQVDEIIAKVARKHNMNVERIVRIAKDMKAREEK